MNTQPPQRQRLFFTPDRIAHLRALTGQADFRAHFRKLEQQARHRPLKEPADYLSGAAAVRAFDLAVLDAAFPGKGFDAQIPTILLYYADLYPGLEPYGRNKLYSARLSASPGEEHVESEGVWHDNVLSALEILGDGDVIGPEEKEALLELFGRDPAYLKSVYVYTGLSPLWAAKALHYARHFKETGERRSAQKSLRLVEEYALWMRHFTTGEWFGQPGDGWHDSPGILCPESLGEAGFLRNILLAYDLVRPCLSRAEQQDIEQKVLRYGVETVFIGHEFHVPKNNHQWGHNAIIGMVGFCLEDEDYVHHALHGPHGFFYHLQEAVNEDGYQYESNFGYHFGCLATYALLAEVAFNSGEMDLFQSPQLRSLFEAPLHYFFHDFGYAPVGDTGTSKQPPPHLYPGLLAELYGTRYGRDDLTYGFYHALDRPQQRWTSLPDEFYHSERRFGNKGRTIKGCSLFEDTGYTILRSPSSTINTCLSWLHNNVGHSHADGLSLVVHWQGLPILPDAGHEHAYLDYLSQAWDRQTLAHNTVVIDQTSQQPRGHLKSDWIQETRPSVQGRLRKFSAQNGNRRLVRVQADRLYPGWQMTRTVSLTDEHLVDVFEVNGSQDACLDYVLHINGSLVESSCPFRAFPDQLGDDAGYELLKNVQAFEGADNCLETRWQVADRRFVRILARLERPDMSVFWGESPHQKTSVLPFLLIRCVASEATFTSMFVPYAEGDEHRAASFSDQDLTQESAAVLAQCNRT